MPWGVLLDPPLGRRLRGPKIGEEAVKLFGAKGGASPPLSLHSAMASASRRPPVSFFQVTSSRNRSSLPRPRAGRGWDLAPTCPRAWSRRRLECRRRRHQDGEEAAPPVPKPATLPV